MNIRSGKRVYSWGEIVYKPQSTYGPRMQAHYQLMFVHSGSVVIETDGIDTPMEAGEVALLNTGHVNYFKFATEESTHHSWIHASSLPGNDPWADLLTMAIDVRQTSRRMGFCLGELLGQPETGHPLRENLYASLAEAAFMEFLAGGDLQPENPRGHPSLERAIGYLRSEFRNPCGLEILGRVSGMSPQHLTRLFRKETGMTPIRYLWKIREDEGLRLLKETGLTISEIADACGFQNPYHFSRRLRQRFGHSPMTLRKRSWTGR